MSNWMVTLMGNQPLRKRLRKTIEKNIADETLDDESHGYWVGQQEILNDVEDAMKGPTK